MSDEFDYGDRKDDGQFENHPTIEEGDFVQPVRESYVHDACGGTTKMGRQLAESWARDPDYYTETFCAVCQDYYPVGTFVWKGTNDRLGSGGGE